MERLVLIALIGSVTAIQMRTVKQEYAVLIGSATAVLLFLEALLQLTGLSETLLKACENYGVSPTLPRTVLKILGIAYLTEFGVNVSKDAGQLTIAGTLGLGGRCMIVSCALPAVISVLEIGVSLIREAIP